MKILVTRPDRFFRCIDYYSKHFYYNVRTNLITEFIEKIFFVELFNRCRVSIHHSYIAVLLTYVPVYN